MEHEEYTRDNYPTSGKKYNGEKAIISLTSWRARINTVDKTIYSLIKQCPGFHIVLVLSEEEFPKREEELPERLMLFVENELIELLWVYKNYKSFKKVLFTMDKYRDVPVISADDDFIYIWNFAEILYMNWLNDGKSIFAVSSVKRKNITIGGGGGGIIYPPYCFGNKAIMSLTNEIVSTNHDDMFIAILAKLMHLSIKQVDNVTSRNRRVIDMETSKKGLGYKNQYKDSVFPYMLKLIRCRLNIK